MHVKRSLVATASTDVGFHSDLFCMCCTPVQVCIFFSILFYFYFLFFNLFYLFILFLFFYFFSYFILFYFYFFYLFIYFFFLGGG